MTNSGDDVITLIMLVVNDTPSIDTSIPLYNINIDPNTVLSFKKVFAFSFEISLIKEKDTRETEIAIEECVSKGIEEFNSLFPDRAKVIMMQIDGMRIESIAKVINRTSDATKVYISECKKKLLPYITHCHSLMITG